MPDSETRQFASWTESSSPPVQKLIYLLHTDDVHLLAVCTLALSERSMLRSTTVIHRSTTAGNRRTGTTLTASAAFSSSAARTSSSSRPTLSSILPRTVFVPSRRAYSKQRATMTEQRAVQVALDQGVAGKGAANPGQRGKKCQGGGRRGRGGETKSDDIASGSGTGEKQHPHSSETRTSHVQARRTAPTHCTFFLWWSSMKGSCRYLLHHTITTSPSTSTAASASRLYHHHHHHHHHRRPRPLYAFRPRAVLCLPIVCPLVLHGIRISLTSRLKGHHLPLRNRLAELQSRILDGCDPTASGVDPAICILPRRLHLTLGVMTLYDQPISPSSASQAPSQSSRQYSTGTAGKHSADKTDRSQDFKGVEPISRSPYASQRNKAKLTIPTVVSHLESIRGKIIELLNGEPLMVPLERMDIMHPRTGSLEDAGVLWLGPDLRKGEEERKRETKVLERVTGESLCSVR